MKTQIVFGLLIIALSCVEASQSCEDPNCAICPELGCEICNTGFAMSMSTYQCEAIRTEGCTTGCAKCNAQNMTDCSECSSGYSFDLMNFNFTCNQCQVSHCEICVDDLSDCIFCQDGFQYQNGQCVQGDGSPYRDYTFEGCTGEGCLVCNKNDTSHCMACGSGQFETEGENGVMCTPCFSDHCYKCTTSPQECTVCEDGFEFTEQGCVQGSGSPFNMEPTGGPECFVPGCLACSMNDPTMCVACAPGFNAKLVEHGQQCLQCNVPNCEVCQEKGLNVCERCSSGFSLTSEGTCSDGQSTTTCNVDNCKTCETSDFCQECSSGFNKTSNGQCEQSSTSCDLPHCKECETSTKCADCDTGFTVSSAGRCVEDSTTNTCQVQNCTQCSPNSVQFCQTCKTGFKATSSGACEVESTTVECTKENCNQCDSSGKCIECEGGFSRTTIGNCREDVTVDCSSIVPNCANCSSITQSCSACNENFILSSTGFCEEARESCADTNCRKCEGDATMCEECRTGFTLNDNYHCDEKNVVGEYGFPTNESCADNCAYCTGPQPEFCLYASQGYAINFQTGQIVECGEGCWTCDPEEPTQCYGCEQGYRSVGPNSDSTATGGNFEQGQECEKCAVDNCLSCWSDASTCDYCETGFSKMEDGSCSSCNIENCGSCQQKDGVNECLWCNQGFYKKNGACVPCSQISPGCASCGQGRCWWCEEGLVINYQNGTCGQCEIDGCSVCETANYCAQCEDGYTRNNDGTCKKVNKVIENCQYQNEEGQCKKCNDGFFVNTQGKCSECDSTCEKCDGEGPNRCTKCLNGFLFFNPTTDKARCVAECFTVSQEIEIVVGNKTIQGPAMVGDPNTGKCVKCSYGCDQCSSPGVCEECKSGFYPKQVKTLSSSTTGSNAADVNVVYESKCEQCHQSCATCNGPSARNCTSCPPSLTLDESLGICYNATSVECPAETFKSGSTCQDCADNCLKCESASKCTRCAKGFFVDDGICSPCGDDCLMCRNEDYCVKCASGKFNLDGQCREECDEGYNLVSLLNFRITDIYESEVEITSTQMARSGMCYNFLKYLGEAISLIQSYTGAGFDGTTTSVWSTEFDNEFDISAFGGLLGLDGTSTGGSGDLDDEIEKLMEEFMNGNSGAAVDGELGDLMGQFGLGGDNANFNISDLLSAEQMNAMREEMLAALEESGADMAQQIIDQYQIFLDSSQFEIDTSLLEMYNIDPTEYLFQLENENNLQLVNNLWIEFIHSRNDSLSDDEKARVSTQYIDACPSFPFKPAELFEFSFKNYFLEDQGSQCYELPSDDQANEFSSKLYEAYTQALQSGSTRPVAPLELYRLLINIREQFSFNFKKCDTIDLPKTKEWYYFLESLVKILNVYKISATDYFPFIAHYLEPENNQDVTYTCQVCRFDCEVCAEGLVEMTSQDSKEIKMCLNECPLGYKDQSGVCKKDETQKKVTLRWLSKDLTTGTQDFLQALTIRAVTTGFSSNATYAWSIEGNDDLEQSIFTSEVDRYRSFLRITDVQDIEAGDSITFVCTVTEGSSSATAEIEIEFSGEEPSIEIPENGVAGQYVELHVANVESVGGAASFDLIVESAETDKFDYFAIKEVKVKNSIVKFKVPKFFIETVEFNVYLQSRNSNFEFKGTFTATGLGEVTETDLKQQFDTTTAITTDSFSINSEITSTFSSIQKLSEMRETGTVEINENDANKEVIEELSEKKECDECKNGGACKFKKNNNFFCVCPQEFSGTRCQISEADKEEIEQKMEQIFTAVQSEDVSVIDRAVMLEKYTSSVSETIDMADTARTDILTLLSEKAPQFKNLIKEREREAKKEFTEADIKEIDPTEDEDFDPANLLNADESGEIETSNGASTNSLPSTDVVRSIFKSINQVVKSADKDVIRSEIEVDSEQAKELIENARENQKQALKVIRQFIPSLVDAVQNLDIENGEEVEIDEDSIYTVRKTSAEFDSTIEVPINRELVSNADSDAAENDDQESGETDDQESGETDANNEGDASSDNGGRLLTESSSHEAEIVIPQALTAQYGELNAILGTQSDSSVSSFDGYDNLTGYGLIYQVSFTDADNNEISINSTNTTFTLVAPCDISTSGENYQKCVSIDIDNANMTEVSAAYYAAGYCTCHLSSDGLYGFAAGETSNVVDIEDPAPEYPGSGSKMMVSLSVVLAILGFFMTF